ADLDGDGDPDLAVSRYRSLEKDNVSVLVNNGDGTFAAPVEYSAGDWPTSVVTGDFDNDGHSDLAVTNETPKSISVFMNRGDGTLIAPVRCNTGGGPWSITIRDLNADGYDDLVVTNGADDNVSVLVSSGDGTFSSQMKYATGHYVNSVAI